MEEFELLRYVTIGQYLPLNSPIHRLDPRFKLVAFTILVIAITFTATYIGNIVLLLLLTGLLILARVPIPYALSGLRPALPFLLFLMAMQIAFYTEGFAKNMGVCYHLLDAWFIHATTCSVKLALVSAARFIELLMLTSLLTLTTTTTELTHGIERLFSPLQRWFNFPAHELALIITIALRFVPTFAEELERIMKAQVSRGADLGQRGRFRFIQQTKAILPVLVPLFMGAFRRAEDLILAMEARCYVGGKGRTHYTELHSQWSDYAAVLIALLLALIVLLTPWPW
ncbi:MAG: energy-coupling factor transporter transmembrane protein EcfT [Chloroflexi bacterium]|nr:energy-coupling factor transporter transmembrane protein EcfT [Chloroflexota bacterium]